MKRFNQDKPGEPFVFYSFIINYNKGRQFFIGCQSTCNRYTIDTISTGAVIAFAMECFEKGILSKGDLDGIELTFGNGEGVLQLIVPWS
jgi:aldehyde:ferredoxin oxidoreductase